VDIQDEVRWKGIARIFADVAHVAGEFKSQGHYLADSPQQIALEMALSDKLGADSSAVTNCGMAAIGTVMEWLLQPGDVAVFSRDIFPGTRRLANYYADKRDVKVIFIDPTDLVALRNALGRNAKIYFTETIGNSYAMPVLDLMGTVNLLSDYWATLVIDTTFNPDFNPLRRILEDRVKIRLLEVASLSKWETYDDKVAGGRISGSAKMMRAIKATDHYRQVVMQPLIAEEISIARQMNSFSEFSANALELALALEASSKVKSVCYPGLPSHPQYELACAQFGRLNCGGVLYAVLNGGAAAAARFTDMLNFSEYWEIAASFGAKNFRILPLIGELEKNAHEPGMVRISSGLGPEGLQAFKKALTSVCL